MFGTWAALIPYVKAKFGLDEAELGLLLLCLPAGTVIMNPFTVPLLRRFGSVNFTLFSLGLAAVVFTLPIMAPAVWLVGLALFATGLSYTCLNISMNTCATELEAQCDLRIMGTSHGLWSAGAMLGSAVAGLVTSWGVHPIQYVLGMAGLQLLVVFLLRKPLSNVPEPALGESPQKTKLFIRPNRELWVLVVIGLSVCLTEGTMADWSGVYMREVLRAPEAQVGLGFATYAFFMASGRFTGDALIVRFGSRRLLGVCGVIACLGLLILVSVPGLAGTLLGFALTGAGVSVGAPILYAESAKVPGLPPGAGLATFNTFSMVGFLGGPAFIGFLAKTWSLPAAFAVVAAAAAVWAWQVRRMG